MLFLYLLTFLLSHFLEYSAYYNNDCEVDDDDKNSHNDNGLSL